MSLIKFKYSNGYGHDWYVQFLNIGNWSLIQSSVSWNDDPSWPYIQIKSGTGSTLSILFWAYRFGFDLDILCRTWNWGYLEKLDEKETELV